MTKTVVSDAVLMYAARNTRNEPIDWFESLEWDGVERLPYFLHEAFGARDTDYARAIGINFMVGMVARVYRPGCKMDNMLVLEGKQGSFKSTALSIIGGKWFAELNTSVTDTNFYLALQGKMLIEIAELDSFSRAEATRIKQAISCQEDRYRAPYERHTADHPRMCVFVGTTNEREYLRDNTGGRRFWPIRCGDIDLKLLKDNRAQYFAEAVARYKRGDLWYETPTKEATDEQELRRQVDEWEHVVSDYLKSKTWVTMTQVWEECLGQEVAKLGKSEQIRLGSVLRLVGWERKRGHDLTGKRTWGWERVD